MNYTKVQFISWELNTGPLNNNYVGLRLNGVADDRLDVYSQCIDIESRISFTSNAINQALKSADSDPSVLKVFMAPEFLYRGAGGAYLHDLIDGWSGPAPTEFGALPAPFNNAWNGLFGGLKQLVSNDIYKNWLFVFGTAISGSFPTIKDPATGKYYLDSTKIAEVYNSSLIQAGGVGNTNSSYVSRKHYISGIDFLRFYTGPNTQHVLSNVHALDTSMIIPQDVYGVPEGGAVFTIPQINDSTGKPINFGIEICLDHSYSGGNGTNHFGRLRTANQSVKIQLVPSAGMSLWDPSIRLEPALGPTPHSYAFNCDGLNNLTPGAGCHTQIWNGSNGATVAPANKLFEVSNGAALPNTSVSRVIATLMTSGGVTINDTSLWSLGSGNVRVINPLQL